ncbi:APC family permease [Sandaracinobacter neustonicus]|uniref:APC family permease n=1 Tax=Sandaracinobacter neustonicus TaxID=1715348 RepID=A0A501XL50_9SPHN|nr:APC family permease [Sandaracinobacter neustonicus]TPE61175.1 APC family permease [Sandaracinobacter neustonicus]
MQTETLTRGIGPLGAALIAFNGIVGAGIFMLPGLVHDRFGAFGPWLFPLFGCVMLMMVLPLAAVAARFDVNGGPVAYVASAFGPFAGFQAGWLFTLAKLTALAANANVFASYLTGLFPGLNAAIIGPLSMLLLIGALTAANVVGVKQSIRLLTAISVLKVLPVLLLVLAALWMFGGALPAPGPFPPLSQVEASALILLYAFVGFENVLVPAGETRDPRRTIPRALVLTLVLTTSFYMLIQFGFLAADPPASEDAPMIAFGAKVAGAAGALVMTLVVLASLTGNLHGNILSSPRLLFAMAERRVLPAWFGRVHARFGTPANAVLAFAGMALLLALTGSFVFLAVLGTIARLFLFLMVYASLPKLRRDAGERAMPDVGLTVVLLIATGLCLWAILQVEADAWAMLVGSVAVGTGLFFVARRGRLGGERADS